MWTTSLRAVARMPKRKKSSRAVATVPTTLKMMDVLTSARVVLVELFVLARTLMRTGTRTPEMSFTRPTVPTDGERHMRRSGSVRLRPRLRPTRPC